MSKRKLMQLVNEKARHRLGRSAHADHLRPAPPRRDAARRCATFAYNIGITKYHGLTDVAVLEHAIREELNTRALRRLAVLRPIKVVITNYPEGQIEELRRRQQSRRSERRHAQDSVQPRALHRAGRFHGNAAAEIFPAQARRRSAAEVRLHHQVRRGGEGCRRQT